MLVITIISVKTSYCQDALLAETCVSYLRKTGFTKAKRTLTSGSSFI